MNFEKCIENAYKAKKSEAIILVISEILPISTFIYLIKGNHFVKRDI